MSLSDDREEQIEGFDRLRASVEHLANQVSSLASHISHQNETVAQYNRVLTTCIMVPVSLGLIAADTWLFYASRISEYPALFILCLALSPWYGDGLKVVLDMIQGRRQSSDQIKQLGIFVPICALTIIGFFLYGV